MESQKGRREHEDPLTRRGFLKGTAAVGAVSLAAKHIPASFAAKEDEPIRVGLVGCGGRGTGAAKNTMESAPNVHVVAMGDVFQDHLDSSRKNLADDASLEGKFLVDDDHCFVGWDAYKNVLASDIDMVILATPPGFRPLHIEAAVEAGKHVFAEKPVAVDPVGIRKVIAAAKKADDKGLKIVAGTQRRHQDHYLKAMEVIHSGQLGDVISANVYWNGGTLWMYPKKEEWSDMEWQMRNWYYFTWICGDHIVEQHVHNIDVANWAKGMTPKRCWGVGGRQVRTDPNYGHIFDHFSIEFEYPDGTVMTSQCRQMKNCKSDVREAIFCQNGIAHLSHSKASITGAVDKQWDDSPNPYVQEHTDLIAAIRSGEHLNEGKRVAESTLCAIMGRLAAYTGQEVTWDFAMNESKLDLSPKEYKWGDMPFPEVAVPGKTPLV